MTIIVTIFRPNEPDEIHEFPDQREAAAIALAMDYLLKGKAITFVRRPRPEALKRRDP